MKKLIFFTLSIFCCMSAFAQWQVVYSDTNVTFYGVHAVDTNIVYACGTGGTIVKSTDGGDTWHKQITPTTQCLTSIQFLDSLYGYAVGNKGNILQTQNGGNSWQALNTGTQAHYHNMAIVNKDIAYVVGNFCDDTVFHDYFFNKDSVFNIHDYYIDPIPYQYYYSIDSSILLKTTDGGISWQPLRTAHGFGGVFTALTFMDSLTGFIGQGNDIYKTTDGGINWIKTINNAHSAYNFYLWTDICFTSRDTGYVGGLDNLLVTYNGGDTFQVVNNTNYYYPSFLSFPSAQIGYIAEIRGLALTDMIKRFPYTRKTVDFGETWKYQMISKTQRALPRTDIFFPSENYGFLIANDIYRTVNGGGEVLDFPYEESMDAIQNIKIEISIFQITPNPNNGKFFINIDTSIPIKHLSIYNVIGKQVYLQYKVSPNSEIDIRHLPAGIYLVCVQTESGNFTQKIIKQ